MILELFDSGMTETHKIAQTLKTSKGMVRVVLSLSGRTPRKTWVWTHSDTQRLVALRNAGKSFKEIADEFGRSPEGVKQRYYKALPRRSRG